jgi:hypothetical protein
MACRTCDMIRGLLLSQGVPPALAEAPMPLIEAAETKIEKKVKRKASAYSKKYGKAFKKVAKKYKKKSGAWKKDGFRLAQKAAHKMAKRMR